MKNLKIKKEESRCTSYKRIHLKTALQWW